MVPLGQSLSAKDVTQQVVSVCELDDEHYGVIHPPTHSSPCTGNMYAKPIILYHQCHNLASDKWAETPPRKDVHGAVLIIEPRAYAFLSGLFLRERVLGLLICYILLRSYSYEGLDDFTSWEVPDDIVLLTDGFLTTQLRQKQLFRWAISAQTTSYLPLSEIDLGGWHRSKEC